MYTSWLVIGIIIFVSASGVNLQNYFINKEVYEETKRRDKNAPGKILSITPIRHMGEKKKVLLTYLFHYLF